MSRIKAEKCSSCGANLTFDISRQILLCEYCGENKTLESFQSLSKYPYNTIQKNMNSWNAESKVVRCVSCGAQEVVEANVLSHMCPFCGSYKLSDTKEVPGMKPSGLLPFLFTKQQIENEFNKWMKSKKFRPNKLKKAKITTFNGVYTPCWVYDSDIITDYDGEFYNESKDSDGDTHRSYFSVNGTRGDSFKDVAVNVGDKITEKDFNILKPFDFSKAVPYNPAYLIGFGASHYSINTDVAFDTAKGYMEQRIKNFIIAEQHADGCSSLNISCKYTTVSYNYLLLPVWIMTYKYKDKEYRIMSNGQTGEIVGTAPYSAIKITTAIIIDLLICIAFMVFVNFPSGVVLTIISLITLLVIIFTN